MDYTCFHSFAYACPPLLSNGDAPLAPSGRQCLMMLSPPQRPKGLQTRRGPILGDETISRGRQIAIPRSLVWHPFPSGDSGRVTGYGPSASVGATRVRRSELCDRAHYGAVFNDGE